MEEQLSLPLDIWATEWVVYAAERDPFGIAYLLRWIYLTGDVCGGVGIAWVNVDSITACIRYDGTAARGQFIEGSPFRSYDAAIKALDKLVAEGIKEKKFINWHLKKVR